MNKNPFIPLVIGFLSIGAGWIFYLSSTVLELNIPDSQALNDFKFIVFLICFLVGLGSIIIGGVMAGSK